MTDKKEKRYNPISAGISYTIGNMLIRGIPFLTLPLFTRILNPAEFGLYNTYLSYENILSILLGFGLYGTIRVAKGQYKERFEEYISAIYGIQILLSMIIYPIIVVVFAYIAPQGWFSTKLLIILLCHCLCTQLYNIASAKFAIKGEVANNLIMAFIMMIGNIVISLLLCLFAFEDERYLGRILGTFLGALIVTIIVGVKQALQCNKFVNKEYWKFGLKMGVPLIPHMLSLTLLSQCDKIMIQALVGDAEAGIYSLAVTLTGIVSVIVTSLDNAWAPWFYKKLEDGSYEEIRKNNNYLIIAFSFFSAVVMLVAPEVIKLMSEEQYWDSVYSFAPLLMSVLFNFIYLIPVNFEYYHKKTGYISFSTVLTGILNLVLNFFFIKYVGYVGAAYATCISKLILLGMHWQRAKKIQNVKIANLSCVILYSILAAVVGALSLIFKDNIIIRYLLVLILSIVLVKILMKVEGVKNFLKKIKLRK